MFGSKKLISSGVMFTKQGMKKVKLMAKSFQVSRSIIIDAAIAHLVDEDGETIGDLIVQSKIDRGVKVED